MLLLISVLKAYLNFGLVDVCILFMLKIKIKYWIARVNSC